MDWLNEGYNWFWQPAHPNNFIIMWLILMVSSLALKHYFTKHGEK